MAKNDQDGHEALHRRTPRAMKPPRASETDKPAPTAETNDPKIHPVIASSAEIEDARVRSKKAAHQAALKGK